MFRLQSRPISLFLILLLIFSIPAGAAALNIAKPGSGFGVVSSGDANIHCGADCSGSYPPSTAVTLTATPDATSFSNFVQWGPGACALAGQNSTCALNTTTSDQTVAAFFSGAAIAGVHSHTVALKSDGTVWAWGSNYGGQLGDGSTTDSNIPVPVSGLSNVIAIAGGLYHTVALKSDGTVWAWGINRSGQLGAGITNTNSQYRTPIQVSSLSSVLAIAGGYDHTVALKSDGTVWAWGYHNYGQLGVGSISTISSIIPLPVVLTDVIAITGGAEHTAALKSDGTVWAWGRNLEGQLGIGSTSTTASNIPVPVSVLTDVIAIAGGGFHTVALKSDGTVWAWGYNVYGQLGNGSTTASTIPVPVSGLSNVLAIAGGDEHTAALKSDGTVWAWGDNNYGQLGDDSNNNTRTTPIQVHGVGNVGFLNLFNATSTTYALSVTKAGTGSGTVSGGGSYAAGAAVNLTATPATGSTFTGWSPSPCAASFAMPANNLTCTATFNTGTPDQTLIERYYQAILSRASDPSGLAFWMSEASRARSLGLDTKDVFQVMANVFFTGAEYLSRNRSDAQYITDLYRAFFNRDPDSSALDYWTQPLTAGLPRSVVLFSFLFSAEFDSLMQGLFGATTTRSELATVGDFYRGFLNRLPDEAGFAFWLGRFRVAQCTNAAAVRVEVESISSQFLASTEYTNRQRSDRDFVADLYYVFLRRGGDVTGFNYWVNLLSNGTFTRDQVRQEFVKATEFQSRVTQIINQGCAP